MSSVAGLVSVATGGGHCATKFAVESLSEALARKVAPLGIRMTIVEPGSFATDFQSSTKIAPPTETYNLTRAALAASFRPEDRGNPTATAAAMLQLIDADQPLRLALGCAAVMTVQAAYAK